MDSPVSSLMHKNYFKPFEVLIEYKNLMVSCPSNIYLNFNQDNLDGVVFVNSGLYQGGVFRFVISIPEEYPLLAPSVKFKSDMFHPLINSSGHFVLLNAFPKWRPRKDSLAHILYYIKNSFTTAVLDNLQEEYCPNKEALKMYKNEMHIFVKLANQCAEISSSDVTIFSPSMNGNTSIRFTALSNSKFNELKKQIMSKDYVKANLGVKPSGNQITDILNNVKSSFTAGVKFLTGE